MCFEAHPIAATMVADHEYGLRDIQTILPVMDDPQKRLSHR